MDLLNELLNKLRASVAYQSDKAASVTEKMHRLLK